MTTVTPTANPSFRLQVRLEAVEGKVQGQARPEATKCLPPK